MWWELRDDTSGFPDVRGTRRPAVATRRRDEARSLVSPDVRPKRPVERQPPAGVSAGSGADLPANYVLASIHSPLPLPPQPLLT